MEFCFIYDPWLLFKMQKTKKTQKKQQNFYYFQGENDSFAWIHAEENV